MVLVVPKTKTSKDIQKRFNRNYCCPYCGTSTKGDPDCQWVDFQVRKYIRTICVACYCDIFPISYGDFYQDSYFEDFQRAANYEKMDVVEFRRTCLRAVLEEIKHRTNRPSEKEFDELMLHIQNLLSQTQK